MAETLLHDHEDKLNGVTLTPSSGGVYEITYGDTLIYSKKATGKFPEPEQIVQTVGAT
ncbi:MAG: Rdx family protein [Chloroflexota bacterium]|nr:Rdx family protein [Chloroflexota bacterium]